MSCGITCRLDPDNPWAELARLQWKVKRFPGVSAAEPKPDQFERWLWGITGMVLVVGQVIILGVLAYVVISTIIAAVS